MLAEAKRKPVDPENAPIEWVEYDIMDLTNIEAIRQVVESRGGFDLISCCSALVLLPDPATAIKTWMGYLKSGGKMIIDVPTEDKTLAYIFAIDLRWAVGTSVPYDRDWVMDIHSLERVYRDAGLQVEQSWRTRSYVPERWLDNTERDVVFEEELKKHPSFEQDRTVDGARKAFEKCWEQHLDAEGTFRDGHALCVTLGRKA